MAEDEAAEELDSSEPSEESIATLKPEVVAAELAREGKLSYLTLRILNEGLENVMKSMMQGIGSLEPLAKFMHQVPDPEGKLLPLRRIIPDCSMQEDRATRLADPSTSAKKTYFELESEALALAGYDEFNRYLDLMYDKDLFPETPKGEMKALAILYAGDQYAEAFVAAYRAMGIIMGFMASQAGAERYTVSNPEYLHYLELLRVRALRGETRISEEERQALALIVYGNLAQIPVERMEPILRLAIKISHLGYLRENVSSMYRKFYNEALNQYLPEFTKIMSEVVAEVTGMIRMGGFKVNYQVAEAGMFPALVAPPGSWSSGRLMGEVTLTPIRFMPVFTSQEMGSINAFFGEAGSGKTLFFQALATYSILRHGGDIVFVPLCDDSNQPALACLPCFECGSERSDLEESRRRLKKLELLGLSPTGLPTLMLNFLTPGDRHLLEAEPVTVFDRIIEVEDPKSFQLDWNSIMSELRRIALQYGFKTPRGIVAVRNLGRLSERENVEIQVAHQLIWQLMDWMERSRISARLQVDEIHEIAPSQVRLAPSDQYRMGGMMSTLLKRARRKGLSVDFSSQMLEAVIPELRELSTNVFWRELPPEQLDLLVKQVVMLPRDLMEVVKELNVGPTLKGTYLWNWYHKPARSFSLVEACLPPHMLHLRGTSNLEVFKAYEETGGNQILADADKVPVIQRCRSTVATKEKRGKTPAPTTQADFGVLK